MRLTQLLAISMFVPFALVACGDDGGTRPVIPVDARPPTPDSPPVQSCTIPSDLGGLGLGSAAMPVSGPIFQNIPDLGGVVFVIRAALPDSGTGLTDLITILVPRPAAGFVPGLYMFDFNAAASWLDQNFVQGQGAQKILDAINGSVTFSAISEGNSAAGTVSATMYREVDDNGNEVPGGCMSSLMGMQFNLVQSNNLARLGDDDLISAITVPLVRVE